MAVSWSRSAWTDYIQIWFVDAWIHGLVPFEGFMAVAPKLAPKSPGILSPKLSPRSLRTYLAQIWCRVVKHYDIMAFIGFCVRVAKTQKRCFHVGLSWNFVLYCPPTSLYKVLLLCHWSFFRYILMCKIKMFISWIRSLQNNISCGISISVVFICYCCIGCY